MSKRLVIRSLMLASLVVAAGVAVSEALPVETMAIAVAGVPTAAYAAFSFTAGLAGLMRLGRNHDRA